MPGRCFRASWVLSGRSVQIFLKMNKIPLNIITGFLGAGKTTVISNLLKSKPENERWAIIINEFGEIAIDYITLQKHTGSNEFLVEIAGGCICCSSNEFFRMHLQQIIEKQDVDRIIVEPTGLGGVEMITEIILEFTQLEIKPIICLVDVYGAGNARLQMNQIYLDQLRNSDIHVISKCDLPDTSEKAAELLDWLKGKFTKKLDYLCIKEGQLPLEILNISIAEGQSGKENDLLSEYFPIFKKDKYIQYTQSLSRDSIITLLELKDVLEKNDSIIRAKGYLRTESGWVFLNLVDNNCTLEYSTPENENAVVIIQKEIAEKVVLKEFLVNA